MNELIYEVYYNILEHKVQLYHQINVNGGLYASAKRCQKSWIKPVPKHETENFIYEYIINE